MSSWPIRSWGLKRASTRSAHEAAAVGVVDAADVGAGDAVLGDASGLTAAEASVWLDSVCRVGAPASAHAPTARTTQTETAPRAKRDKGTQPAGIPSRSRKKATNRPQASAASSGL